MRKCYQSFKRLLTGQEGSMAPAAVAAAIAMLLIILGVSEYMRLVITAAGIKDAMESAVVSVVNDNYNEVYHGVREGYAAGYELDDTGFTASVDHGDIYGRMCFLLGLEEDGNSYVRYNNSGELEYRLKNLSVDIHNTALASPGGTYYADAEVTMEVPVRFAGKILSNMSVVTISFNQIVYFNQCVLLLLIFAKIKYRKCPQVKQRMGNPRTSL